MDDTYYPKRIASKLANGDLVLRKNSSKRRCWEVFAEIDDLNGQPIQGFVQCRVCEKVFIYKKFSSSNLVRHKCYVEKFAKKPENSISIIKVEDSQVEFQKIDVLDKNHLMKLITKWIINDCKSYNVIQDTRLRTILQEFLSLGAKCGPEVDILKYLPSSTSVARNVEEMYKQCSDRLRSELKAIKKNGFGLSTDIWTDAYTKRSYITVTIHYLKSRTLTYCLLGLKSIDGTKSSIYDTMEIILKDFDCKLSNKSIIVTNNDGDAMEAFSNNKTLPCISHLLNNALQKSIEEVPDIVELARDCAKLLDFLNKLSSDNSINSLQCYSPGHWSSIYNMFKTIVNKWNKISQILKGLNESERLKCIQLHHLKTIIKALKPFEEAIEALEEDSEPTLHLVLIYLHELIKFCDTNDEEDFQHLDFIERLKENVQFHLEIIFTENMTILHKIALFLYPPTNKLLLFSDQQKQSIEDECEHLCLENETTTPMGQAKSKIVTAAMVKRYQLFSDFVEPDINLSPNELIKQELQCYKSMRVSNSEDFDCFNWWEMHKDVFPFLYKLSCCILATPASTASTKQIFAATGNLLGEITLDSRSNATEVEKMIFINFNGDQDELDSQQ